MSKKRSKSKKKKQKKTKSPAKKKAEAQAAPKATEEASTETENSEPSAGEAKTTTKPEEKTNKEPEESTASETAVAATETSAATDEAPDDAAEAVVDSPEAPPQEGSDPWNPVSVGFYGIGILIGLGLLIVGGMRTYHVFDLLWVQQLGETKGYVTDVTRKMGKKGKPIHLTTIMLDKFGRFPKAKVVVKNKRLFDFVKYRYHPPRLLRVSAVRIHRTLSGQAGIARVGPIRLIRPPKSADLITAMGLLIIGAALCFTSLRDLRKRWLRRGLRA